MLRSKTHLTFLLSQQFVVHILCSTYSTAVNGFILHRIYVCKIVNTAGFRELLNIEFEYIVVVRALNDVLYFRFSDVGAEAAVQTAYSRDLANSELHKIRPAAKELAFKAR